MPVLVGIRRAVARPSARAGLTVAAIAWAITRVSMYLIDAGIVRGNWSGAGLAG
jgi:hypothetical protein